MGCEVSLQQVSLRPNALERQREDSGVILDGYLTLLGRIINLFKLINFLAFKHGWQMFNNVEVGLGKGIPEA